ncbi:MBL fold metallo-hydrolase [Microbacterium karelineae]|uniref:MBL fold metallo-hydrolase n=1 Tax=Microbacterium karelineae TaxID=2654283 RepID=UPI0012E9E302|nr:MBL fold metallo-hydrolase [Microbacterium karelineae]
MTDIDEAPADHDPGGGGVSLTRRQVFGGLAGSLLLGGVAGGAIGGAVGARADGSSPSPQVSDAAAPSDGPRAPLEVITLGTKGGPPPDPDRAGISTAVIVDGAVYVVDAGRGSLTQYVRAGLALADLTAMFVTHLHIDHVADLYDYFLLGGNANFGDTVPDRVPVYGPGPAGWLPEPFEGAEVPTVGGDDPTPGLTDVLDTWAGAHAYSTNLFIRGSSIRDPRGQIDDREIDVSGVDATAADTAPRMDPLVVHEDDRVRLSAILVPHGGVFPAFAYRFDTDHGSVTLSGDTTYSDNLLSLARDTDILIHEAVNVEGFDGPPALIDHLLTSHIEIQRAGEVAQAAGARRLVMSHVGDLANDVVDPARWKAWAQEGYDGEVTIANDLDRFRV